MESIITDSLVNLTAGALVVLAVYLMTNAQVKVTTITTAASAEATKAATEATRTATAANTEATRAAAIAFTEGVRTLKEAQEGQRVFFQNKVDEQHKETQALIERIHQLEVENDLKDKRINELERENKELKSEIDVLRKRMNGADKKTVIKKPAPRKKAE